MEIIGTPIYDQRIDSWNIMLSVSLEEYYDLSKNVLSSNEYQRRRVKSSSTVYSLLKEDLKKGCLMPPIVMALATEIKSDDPKILDKISESKDKLVILDGLQRSYTIRDLIQDLNKDDDKSIAKNNKIRIEIYVGINKLGVLYRMLTLNTGQTPMSTRHQIEIIYSDYNDIPDSDIKLLREVDDETPKNLGEYKFREVIDGFTSYLERDYLTLDRTDILDNIRSLEKLSSVDPSNQLFEVFVKAYDSFIQRINELSANWELPTGSENIPDRPFGKNVRTIFNKSQALTGFGSAVGKLIDNDLIKRIENISVALSLVKSNNLNDGLKQIVIDLEKVRKSAKKIGNDQRMYFHFLFREFFRPDNTDTYLNLSNSAKAAYKHYERNTM